MMMTTFKRNGKKNAFLNVLGGLRCSMIKHDNVNENNVNDDFQSERKNQCIFDVLSNIKTLLTGIVERRHINFIAICYKY